MIKTASRISISAPPTMLAIRRVVVIPGPEGVSGEKGLGPAGRDTLLIEGLQSADS